MLASDNNSAGCSGSRVSASSSGARACSGSPFRVATSASPSAPSGSCGNSSSVLPASREASSNRRSAKARAKPMASTSRSSGASAAARLISSVARRGSPCPMCHRACASQARWSSGAVSCSFSMTRAAACGSSRFSARIAAKSSEASVTNRPGFHAASNDFPAGSKPVRPAASSAASVMFSLPRQMRASSSVISSRSMPSAARASAVAAVACSRRMPISCRAVPSCRSSSSVSASMRRSLSDSGFLRTAVLTASRTASRCGRPGPGSSARSRSRMAY